MMNGWWRRTVNRGTPNEARIDSADGLSYLPFQFHLVAKSSSIPCGCFWGVLNHWLFHSFLDFTIPPYEVWNGMWENFYKLEYVIEIRTIVSCNRLRKIWQRFWSSQKLKQLKVRDSNYAKRYKTVPICEYDCYANVFLYVSWGKEVRVERVLLASYISATWKFWNQLSNNATNIGWGHFPNLLCAADRMLEMRSRLVGNEVD